jgi:hypothetical protein
MQQNNQRRANGLSNHLELNRLNAYHAAGHATALYLENKRKNLPLIYFKIVINKQDSIPRLLFTKVSGGRLVGDLATITQEHVFNHWNATGFDSQQRIYEADIINFLAGFLAEAKYVAIRDNEAFNINLLTPHGLQNYGVDADMQEVMSYLEIFIPNPEKRAVRFEALFAEAFNFVEQDDNWKSIVALANYILNHATGYISCEQTIAVLAPNENRQAEINQPLSHAFCA